MKWITQLLLIFGSFYGLSQDETYIHYYDSLDLLPRDDAIAFSTDNGVYLGTGNHGSFTESNRFYKLNEFQDNVEEVSSFPGVPRQYATATNLEEFGIVIGGISSAGIPLNEVWVYNSELDDWEERATPPFEPRWAACAFKIHQTIYFGSGRDTAQAFNDFWKYDFENDSWSEVADLPVLPRFETVGFSIYQKGFVGLGKEYDGDLQSDFYTYDPDLNSWSEVASFPAGARYYSNAECLQGFGYVIGGQDITGSIQKDLWRYNPLNDSWEELNSDYVPARRGMTTCVLNDKKLLAFCGLDEDFARKSSLIIVDKEKPSPVQGTLRNCTVFYDAIHQSLYFSEVYINDFIRIYNMNGALIFTYQINDENLGIDCSEMVAGCYVAVHGSCKIKFVVGH